MVHRHRLDLQAADPGEDVLRYDLKTQYGLAFIGQPGEIRPELLVEEMPPHPFHNAVDSAEGDGPSIKGREVVHEKEEFLRVVEVDVAYEDVLYGLLFLQAEGRRDGSSLQEEGAVDEKAYGVESQRFAADNSLPPL